MLLIRVKTTTIVQENHSKESVFVTVISKKGIESKADLLLVHGIKHQANLINNPYRN